MPCAPAASAIADRRATSGMPFSRVFRSVAILLTLTDRWVTGASLFSVAESVGRQGSDGRSDVEFSAGDRQPSARRRLPSRSLRRPAHGEGGAPTRNVNIVARDSRWVGELAITGKKPEERPAG